MFSAGQSRKLDEFVMEAAVALHEPMMALVKEISDQVMEQKFGKVWDVAELHAAEVRVHTVTERDVAREMTSRLVERLMNPHALPETV